MLVTPSGLCCGPLSAATERAKLSRQYQGKCLFCLSPRSSSLWNWSMCYLMSGCVYCLQIHQFLAAVGEGSEGLALWGGPAPPDMEGGC